MIRNTARRTPRNMGLTGILNELACLVELDRHGLLTRGDRDRIADLEDEAATR